MIHLSQVEFQYPDGDFRFRAGDFALRAQSQAAMIGPSGSGKTTLLNLLAGILSPTAGEITVDGVNVAALGESARRAFRARRIGLIFQEFELIEYLSVLDNILLPFHVNSALRLTDAARDRARELAGKLGVSDKLRRFPSQLSQGEKQRVAICRALAASPKLILADEPTGNLDPSNRDRVTDLLLDSAREFAVTLLVVTHDHALLDRFEEVIDFDQQFPSRPSEHPPSASTNREAI
ncbi:MAG: ABC transporter ATP-binding protein [Planctomycetales bacterium]